MKKSILLIACTLSLSACSGQKVNKDFDSPVKHDASPQSFKGNAEEAKQVQNASFICRMNEYMIYSTTLDEGEYPLHRLYALSFKTNEATLIDSMITGNCWSQTSDSALLYAKSGKLFLWNANTGTKSPFMPSSTFDEIIAIGFIHDLSYLVLFDFNPKKNKLRLNVFNRLNQNIFNRNLEIQFAEVEGIYPVIESVNEYLVFSVQNHLFLLDVKSSEPVLKSVSDKCDDFSIYEDKGILFYKFISDEKTSGFISFFEDLNVVGIDPLLDEKIYNCVKSDLFSIQNKDRKTPLYLICGMPYIFSDSKWHSLNEVILYQDEQLLIKLIDHKGNFNDRDFEWSLSED